MLKTRPPYDQDFRRKAVGMLARGALASRAVERAGGLAADAGELTWAG